MYKMYSSYPNKMHNKNDINKFPKFPPAMIGKYPGITCFTRKVFCDVPYEDGDPLYFGLILKTLFTNKTQYYSIATGKVGNKLTEKNGVKYYEIYPELYRVNEAKIVSSAFGSIKWADEKVNIKKN